MKTESGEEPAPSSVKAVTRVESDSSPSAQRLHNRHPPFSTIDVSSLVVNICADLVSADGLHEVSCIFQEMGST